MLKAIETNYHNCRFRSRLEARWAVFFDVLDIRWEYEPEGYKLKSGAYYLPDFYWPDEDILIEIKPFNFNTNVEHSQIEKYEEISQDKTFILIVGSPLDDKSYHLHLFDGVYDWKEPGVFAVGRKNQEDIYLHFPDLGASFTIIYTSGKEDKGILTDIQPAFRQASSARFGAHE